MTPIASRSLWATTAVAPALTAPSAAAPPWVTLGVNGPEPHGAHADLLGRRLERRPASGGHPGVARTGEVEEVPVTERGQVRDDLAAALDVVEDHAGQARELAADQHDRALAGDLLEVLVGQPAGGEQEPVDRR